MKFNMIFLALGLLVGCQPSKLDDQQNNQKGLIKVTIMYPNGEDTTFDMDYYKTKHMPMLAKLFGQVMIKYEIDEGVAGRTPEDDIPYLAIGYMYFNSLSDYEGVFGPNSDQILNDIPNYTNIRPTVQISRMIR